MKPPRLLFIFAVATATAGCASLMTEQPEELDARHRMDRGLSALEAGAYPAAFDDLAWVYTNCWGREAGAHALVALAGLELDPRNDRARPSVGTDLLGRAITGPGTPRWARPLVETSFLTALALGAPHPGEPHDAHEGDPAAPPADTAPADVREPAPGEPPADDHAAEEHADDEPATTAEAALDPPTAGAARGCGPAVPAEGWIAPPLPELPGPSMTDLLARAESRRDSLAIRTDFLQRELTTALEELQATRAELERIRRTLKP